MPSKTSKLVRLSAAIAALGVPAAVMPSLAAAAVEGAISPTSERDPTTIQIPVGADLMNFVIGAGQDGTIVADHSSHASHASHASHSSHSSHYSSR